MKPGAYKRYGGSTGFVNLYRGPAAAPALVARVVAVQVGIYLFDEAKACC
jgi:hypothetical protein